MACSSRRPCHSSPSTLLFTSFRSFCFLVVLLSFVVGHAHGQANTTDPSEVAALNSIFSSWKISSSRSVINWNTSGDPCSGAAIDSTTLDDPKFNPGILCNCSSSMCHITELKVAPLQQGPVEGNLSNEIQNLKELTRLQLYGNSLTGKIPPFFGNLTSLKYLNLSSNVLSGSIPMELGSLENLVSL